MRHGVRGKKIQGVTLVELVVTLSVLAILAAAAIPSFVDFRERAAVRGAGDQLVSFWANARLEALKRNQEVAITLSKSGSDMCIGASTDTTGCDCFTAQACDVGQYPAEASERAEWRGVTPLANPTLGPTDSDAVGLAVIDPKRGYLNDEDDDGGLTIQSPANNRYRLRFYVDRWARAYLCAPTDSPLTLPDYSNRTCAP